MNDLLIKVSKRSRLIDLDHSTLGIVGENLQEKLIFTFQDEFVDGMARLEYELDGEKHYVLMEKVGQSYILPVQNVLLSKEGNIDLQLVITEDKTGTPVFKSEVFTLYCKKSIEAVGEAPSSYELWIEKANRILLEASRVNIDGKKTGNETLITITQKDGNKKSFPILDGQDGQDGQDGNGIVSIEKTSTSTLVDTYTITFTDGTTTTFEVTNGNGIVSIEKTSTSGLVDTYTITFTDGTTTTYTVTNGETQDLSNYVQKTEFNESQAEQDDTTRELQAELDRYKLLENALPHTENETPSDYVTLENTAKSPMEIETIPQTSQDGEPTPDNPQEINRTTGEQKIKIVNANLFNKNTISDGYIDTDGRILVSDNYKTSDFIEIDSSIRYAKTKTNSPRVKLFDKNKQLITTESYSDIANFGNAGTFSIPYENAKYIRFTTRIDQPDSTVDKVMFATEGTLPSSYEENEETTYTLSLGNKEMFNINGVYDGFVYDEAPDKFYINRKIGKIVLDGSEDNWEKFADGVFRLPIANAKEYNWNVLGAIKSDKYIAITQQQAQGTDYDYGISLRTSNTGIVIRNKDYTTTADFKTYLSTNNTTVVYQLATSILEEITDTTLISQLRAIKNALSMQGTTHIISTSSGTNLPFLIKARAVQTIERT